MAQINCWRRNKAFTLIELLVVIAIISLLAAILFPVFSRVREKGRQTACLSNMKQLSLGILQYAGDYDDTFPCGRYSGSAFGWNGTSCVGNSASAPSGVGWAGQIFPYVKSTDVFRCPSETSKVGTTTPTRYILSYAYNVNMTPYASVACPTGGQGLAGPPVRLSQMNSPVRTALLFEVTGTNGNALWSTLLDGETQSNAGNGAIGGTGSSNLGGNFYTYATGPTENEYPCPTGGNLTCGTIGRHNDGSNFMAADGHVKWLPSTQVCGGFNNNHSTNAAGAGNTAEGTAYSGGHTLTFSVN